MLCVVDDARALAGDGHAAWSESFNEMFMQVAGSFSNARVRRHGRAYVLGLLSQAERKNSWQLAEFAGDASPDGVQRLLNFSPWDEDAARDAPARYVVKSMGDPAAVLAVDETGFLKKGHMSAGVSRQYTGTAGRIENCQVGVFAAYVTPDGGRAPGQRATHDNKPGADAGDQLRRDASGDGEARRDGEVGGARFDGRVVQDLLHVEGDVEEHREGPRERDQLRRVRGHQPLDAQDRERNKRVAASPLVDREGGEQNAGHGEHEDGLGGAPADFGCPHQGVDQRQHACGDEHGALGVEAVRSLPAGVAGEQPERPGQHEQAYRRVHEQHPAPPWTAREQAAEEHACRGSHPADRAPDSECGVAVLALAEGRGELGQRGRRHQRRAHALHKPGADQHTLGAGQAAGQR